MLVHGFARVRCESCKDELLVAFSCKGRGVCPSCNAKRAHVTAVHLVEQVLPHVPYRQWTLSFPHRVRWVLLKEAGLLSSRGLRCLCTSRAHNSGGLHQRPSLAPLHLPAPSTGPHPAYILTDLVQIWTDKNQLGPKAMRGAAGA